MPLSVVFVSLMVSSHHRLSSLAGTEGSIDGNKRLVIRGKFVPKVSQLGHTYPSHTHTHTQTYGHTYKYTSTHHPHTDSIIDPSP